MTSVSAWRQSSYDASFAALLLVGYPARAGAVFVLRTERRLPDADGPDIPAAAAQGAPAVGGVDGDLPYAEDATDLQAPDAGPGDPARSQAAHPSGPHFAE